MCLYKSVRVVLLEIVLSVLLIHKRLILGLLFWTLVNIKRSGRWNQNPSQVTVTEETNFWAVSPSLGTFKCLKIQRSFGGRLGEQWHAEIWGRGGLAPSLPLCACSWIVSFMPTHRQLICQPTKWAAKYLRSLGLGSFVGTLVCWQVIFIGKPSLGLWLLVRQVLMPLPRALK